LKSLIRGINIFFIDSRGPQYTRHDYVSMYNNTNHKPLINLGYIVDDNNKHHFVLILKLNCLLTEKYNLHKKPICSKCNAIFSNRQDLMNHKLLKHLTEGCAKS
jgi:hypothetical protein